VKDNLDSNKINLTSMDLLDHDFLNPRKKWRYGRDWPWHHPNPSYNTDNVPKVALLLKELDMSFREQIKGYPPPNFIPELSSVEENTKFFPSKEVKEKLHKFSSFQCGIYAAFMKIYYDGSVDDFQQFRHYCYDIFIAHYDMSMRKTVYNMLLINDLKKNKDKGCYMAGKKWGTNYLRRIGVI